MVNEQFTWLTPRSQQEQVGLPGLTDDTTDLGAPSAHNTKSPEGHEEHKVGVEYQRFPAGGDAGPAGRCWRDARPRQRCNPSKRLTKRFFVRFVSLVFFVKSAEGATVIERRVVVSSRPS